MLRVAVVLCFLSIAACISYPEVTTVEETRDAPVSLDGSAERIRLVEDLGLDASVEASSIHDAGVPPHPEPDAEDAGDDPGKGKGKGKPPRKKD